MIVLHIYSWHIICWSTLFMITYHAYYACNVNSYNCIDMFILLRVMFMSFIVMWWWHEFFVELVVEVHDSTCFSIWVWVYWCESNPNEYLLHFHLSTYELGSWVLFECLVFYMRDRLRSSMWVAIRKEKKEKKKCARNWMQVWAKKRKKKKKKVTEVGYWILFNSG